MSCQESAEKSEARLRHAERYEESERSGRFQTVDCGHIHWMPWRREVCAKYGRMQERHDRAKDQQRGHATEFGNGEDVLDELAPFHTIAVKDRDEHDDHDGQQLRGGTTRSRIRARGALADQILVFADGGKEYAAERAKAMQQRDGAGSE